MTAPFATAFRPHTELHRVLAPGDHDYERDAQERRQRTVAFVAVQEQLREAAERMGWRFEPAEPFAPAAARCGDSWISVTVYPDESIRARKWRDGRRDGLLADPAFTSAFQAPDFREWMLDLCVTPGRCRPIDLERMT